MDVGDGSAKEEAAEASKLLDGVGGKAGEGGFRCGACGCPCERRYLSLDGTGRGLGGVDDCRFAAALG